VDSTKIALGRVKGLHLASLVLVSTVALAESAPADRPTSPPVRAIGSAWWLAPPWYERVEIEATRDPSLGLRPRHTASGGGASTRRAFRASDRALSVTPGKVAFSLPAQPAGLHLDLRFVPGGDAAADGGTNAIASAVLKRVRQAYATVMLFNLLTVDVGKFVNVADPGVIEATSDWLGSRAQRLADASGQAGLRFALPVGEVLTLRGSVLASQAWKMFNLSATVHQPLSGTSVFLDFSGGPNVNSDLRLLFDVVVTQVLHGEMPVTDSIRLVGHVEYFADRLASGLGSNRAPVDFITATVGVGLHFAGAANFELRPELRRDQSLGGAPASPGGANDSRYAIELAAIARF
jgi:hypothetical protein